MSTRLQPARGRITASEEGRPWLTPLLLVIAVCLVAIAYLAVGRSPSQEANPPQAGALTTPTDPAVPSDPQDQTITTTAPTLTLTGQECGRSGAGAFAAAAAGNDKTSCPFALSVQQAYLAAGVQGSTATVRAHSPVTNKWYDMACSGAEPAKCTGGNDAVVYLYGGTARFIE